MTTKTTTTKAPTDNDLRPVRSYQITYTSGRRERLDATKVLFPQGTGENSGMVHFHAADPENSWAGRLILAVGLWTLAEIRDLDADIAEVWTAKETVKRSFWQTFWDAFTFNTGGKR